jgi:hypothetical protein
VQHSPRPRRDLHGRRLAVDGGELRIAGQVVDDMAPGDRDVTMVFQNYARCTLQLFDPETHERLDRG